MKTLIKISFILVLLATVFNIGLNNAYAKELKTAETNNIESVDAISLQCKIYTLANIATLLNNNEPESIRLMIDPLVCTPSTRRVGNTVWVVQSNCYVYAYKINPNKE